jgi:hypothetical protein
MSFRVRCVVSAIGLGLLAGAAQAQVALNPATGNVTIKAAGQPISSLLDQLARQTGMTIDYEKTPPRQTVNLTIEDRTPAQAIVALLDAVNIPYALSLSADGSKVQSLVVADVTAPPKGGRPRVGRETSMTPPDDPTDAPQPDPGAAPDAVPSETVDTPKADTPPQRRMPQAAPLTTSPAFPAGLVSPNAPAFPGASAFPGAPPEPVTPQASPSDAPPQKPQAEKDPNV